MLPFLKEALRRALALAPLGAKVVSLLRLVFRRWDILSLLYLYRAEIVAVGLVNVVAMGNK